MHGAGRLYISQYRAAMRSESAGVYTAIYGQQSVSWGIRAADVVLGSNGDNFYKKVYIDNTVKSGAFAPDILITQKRIFTFRIELHSENW